MAGIDNLKPLDSKRAAEIGAKGGRNKLGKKHINTWVQELLHDPEFEQFIRDPKLGWIVQKGAPIKAVVQAQIKKALDGDTKAYDSLVKSGWATKQEVDVSSLGEKVSQPIDMDMVTQFMMMAKDQTKQ